MDNDLEVSKIFLTGYRLGSVKDQPKGFGANLRMLREAAGMQSNQLAVEVRVKPPTMSKWESKRTPPAASTLLKLATALGCTVDDLLKGVDPRYDEVVLRNDLIRHEQDQQSGFPSTVGDAHDPAAARLELQELRDRVSRYEKEAREVRTVTDSLAKVALALEEIRKAPTGTTSRRGGHRKMG